MNMFWDKSNKNKSHVKMPADCFFFFNFISRGITS
jgi:hypothetical protein